MSTTARLPIKPKTLTLMELCQSMNDFRQAPFPPPPPATVSSYQYQSAASTAQILTRRLYLHPLTINSDGKQVLAKSELTGSESDFRPSLNLEKRKSKGSPHRGLAILPTSFPLLARITGKPEARLSRDQSSTTVDTDTTSETDVSWSKATFTPPTLPPIIRRRNPIRTRPARVKPPTETPRWNKTHVWFKMDQVIHRTTPVDPPSTPAERIQEYHLPTLEREQSSVNVKTIQEIRIYKRNAMRHSAIDEDEPIYDDSLFV